jgi:hypothetical protein
VSGIPWIVVIDLVLMMRSLSGGTVAIIRVGMAAARNVSVEQRAGGFCEGQLGDRRRAGAFSG